MTRCVDCLYSNEHMNDPKSPCYSCKEHRNYIARDLEIETTIKSEGNFIICQKCESILPPQLIKFQYRYCPMCGRKIVDKQLEINSVIEECTIDDDGE